MSRNGDVVSLPHDLRIPFARYLARLKLNNFKRYSFGKVVKEKKVKSFKLILVKIEKAL